MRNRRKLFWIAPLAIVGIALFIAIGGGIVMYLWNWLLPPLFGWKLITFWQALALLVLCRILVGGFGMRGGPRHSRGRWMANRWGRMSDEEREEFRQRMRERCGFPPPAADAPAK